MAKMDLGAFSVSLAVKDLAASRAFYEKLGFEAFAGEPEQNWQILRNGDHVIGLFQGMFEGNILTFNPGWANDTSELAEFVDVREWRRRLVQAGVTVDGDTTGDSDSGPASFMVLDPDGNPILIDQHR